MRISDWSSDVCSSDLRRTQQAIMQAVAFLHHAQHVIGRHIGARRHRHRLMKIRIERLSDRVNLLDTMLLEHAHQFTIGQLHALDHRSEERRVGNECVDIYIYRWSLYDSKTNTK